MGDRAATPPRSLRDSIPREEFNPKLSKGNEDEIPFQDSRMRDDQIRLFDFLVPVEQKIEIQNPALVDAGRMGTLSASSEPRFDVQEVFKQAPGGKLGLDLHHPVQKITAPFDADSGILDPTRAGGDRGRGDCVDSDDRPLQRSQAVSEVAT